MRSRWRRMTRPTADADGVERAPGKTPGDVLIHGVPTRYVDGPSSAPMLRSIFEREVYWFAASRDDPRIIDCGANVGFAVIYWKQMYPRSRITAFEPDPAICDVLRGNLRAHDLDDVEVVQAAVWSKSGVATFHAEGTDAGRLAIGLGAAVEVNTVRLAERLRGAVDLLKMDIEGAEVEVLVDCGQAGALDGVNRIFCEYHSLVGAPQRLDDLLRVLRSAGYRYYLDPELPTRRPFSYRPAGLGIDNQVNIYAWR